MVYTIYSWSIRAMWIYHRHGGICTFDLRDTYIESIIAIIFNTRDGRGCNNTAFRKLQKVRVSGGVDWVQPVRAVSTECCRLSLIQIALNE